MSAHTKGPWEAVLGDNYAICSDAYPDSYPHRCKEDDTGPGIAYVGNRTDDFGEANARLIAAAPCLLEALQMLVADFGDYPAAERPCLAFDKARAAIAKALGAP